MEVADALASAVYQNLNTPYIIGKILANFDSAEHFSYWFNLLQVCRQWRDIVRRFSRAGLSPYQLYYDAAAIATHDVEPDLAVFMLLPHGLLANRMIGVKFSELEKNEEEFVELRKASYDVCFKFRKKPYEPRKLGWGGVEAVRAMNARWPIPKIWIPFYVKLWIYNGAFECAAALGGEVNYKIGRRTSWPFPYRPEIKYPLLLYLACARRYLRVASSGRMYTDEREKQLRSVAYTVRRYDGIRLPADIASDQVKAYTLFKRAIECDHFDTAERLLSYLKANAFNCALLWLVSLRNTPPHKTPDSSIEECMQVFVRANADRPRYNPAYFTAIDHPQRRAILDSLRPMASVDTFDYHRHAIHDPTTCFECGETKKAYTY